MKKYLIMILICSLLVCVRVYSSENSNFIELYKSGKYAQAAEVLEKLKNKDSKIYCYLGQAYFKAGNKAKAKKYFLTAYYLAPKSSWGKAAYKNYICLIKRKLNFTLAGGINYDPNISNLPEDVDLMEREAFSDLYFKSLFSVIPSGSLSYSYSRNQYFTANVSHDDRHSIGMDLYKKGNEFNVTASYAALDGAPLYVAENIGYRKGMLGLEVGSKRYYGEYEYLNGYELSGSLLKKIKNVNIEYKCLVAEAEDLKEYFIYQSAEGTLSDAEYEFTEAETGAEYFLSSSYLMHQINAGRKFRINKKITLNISSGCRTKIYNDKNYWYSKYWLHDAASGIWYYYDSENEEWNESALSPPGKRYETLRRDTKLDMKISAVYIVGDNADIEIAYLYENNISNMDSRDIYNYNWSKGVPSVRFNYSF